MAVLSQNRQEALLQAFSSRPSSLKKHKEQRHQEIWLPCILLGLSKPYPSLCIYFFWFPLDIKMRSKWPNLIRHLHFSRFHFLLDQVFPPLLFFTQHFISSIFSRYQIVWRYQGANLRDPCLREKSKWLCLRTWPIWAMGNVIIILAHFPNSLGSSYVRSCMLSWRSHLVEL